MSSFSLEGFEAADFEALLDRGEAERDGAGQGPELHRLSRRISAQYVDVLASFSHQAFAGRASSATQAQVRVALEALVRLARSTKDEALVEVLAGLEALLPRHRIRGGQARGRFMRSLRAWVLRFAALLPPEDGQRLHDLVVYDRKSLPLLDELARLRGIGEKRLERLYCAGLFTVEAVSVADPHEVAQVTGLPRRLAERVVEAALAFAEAERRRCVADLRRRAAELEGVLRGQGRVPDPGDDLVREARAALADLQSALAHVPKPEEG